MRPSGIAAIPAATIRWVGSRVRSVPPKRMRPRRGRVRPRIERMSVVLPEPFEPRRQVIYIIEQLIDLAAASSATLVGAK